MKSADKYGKIKAFRLPSKLNERFKAECKSTNVPQGVIIELLIIRWLKLKSNQAKRIAKVYNETS